jgi:hypothetical protein
VQTDRQTIDIETTDSLTDRWTLRQTDRLTANKNSLLVKNAKKRTSIIKIYKVL